MISSLRGKITNIGKDSVELEVNGVGYEIQISVNSEQLTMGTEIKLHIFMAVSESDIRLFGFMTDDELNVFKMLITVSGVGPKTAAQILAASANASASRGPAELMKAIGDADVGFFEKIKGVGKKTAQRIIVDLKGKINNQNLDMAAFADGPGEPREDDLFLSLKQLGFDRKEIEKVTKKVPVELTTTEGKLSWCLQNLG